jgi:hypothetical protein
MPTATKKKPAVKKTAKPDKRDRRIEDLESLLKDANYIIESQERELIDLKFKLSDANAFIKRHEGIKDALVTAKEDEGRRMYHLLRVFAKDPLINFSDGHPTEFDKEMAFRHASYDGPNSPRFI